ncbi:MAG: TonB-dependent receptor, partial [Ignavibacteriales bacterium CG_4_9_14_3_um_filter_34_10]
MKQFITVLFIFVFVISLSAQNYSIRGRITAKESRESLAGANVLIYHLPDSTMKGTTSDNDGRFLIENIKSGNYALIVRFIGYKTHKENFEIQNRSLTLGNIQMDLGEVETKEVRVVEQAIPVVQKQDTTEFSAQAFKTNKDADAENLVTKMPGISMQDGKVQAHGEEVKKVLVDGKQFFGDDPSAVLKNIPAEIVDRIQVYDQQSEQSQFTGFDDGNTSKTINVVTRFRNIKGTF